MNEIMPDEDPVLLLAHSKCLINVSVDSVDYNDTHVVEPCTIISFHVLLFTGEEKEAQRGT